MLNEIYEPQRIDDLAWSRPKLTALTALIDGLVQGPLPPRAVLLHGPTGNGKLSSLKVLLRLYAAKMEREQSAAVPAAPSRKPVAKTAKSASILASLAELSQPGSTEREDSPAGPALSAHTPPPGEGSCDIRVLHSCQSSPMEYCRFLREITASCRGEACAAAIAMETERRVSGAQSGSSAPSPLLHAYIVKFYGEPANHHLHEYTRAFMAEYEQLLDQARPALLHGVVPPRGNTTAGEARGQTLAAAAAAGALLLRMRRHLVFFVHTTHDTHSEKMDLGTAFPREVLRSPALDLFHCTPITELAVQRRLAAVLDQEAARRWRDGRLTLARSRKGRGVPTASTRVGSRRRGRAKAASSNPQGDVPTGDVLLSPEEVRAVAAAGQGDMRQSLLQVQWLVLLPPDMNTEEKKREFLLSCRAEGGSGSGEGSARAKDAVWKEVERNVGAIMAHITGSHGSPMQRSEADDRMLCVPAKGDALQGATEAEQGEEDPAVVSSEDDVDSVSSGSLMRVDEVGQGIGLTPLADSGHALPKGGKPSNERSGGGSARPAKRKRSVVDLMESSLDDNVADDLDGDGGSLPPLSAQSKRARHEGDGGGGGVDGKETRVVASTVRDEYLGLSHATARLLTQKYTLRDVVGVLNVAPRKILGYLTNNLLPYFLPHQLSDYEACAAAGSEADALHAQGGGLALQAGSQFRRNALDARTSGQGGASNRTTGDEDATGMAEQQQLDLMALSTFDLAYRVFHRDVHVPRAFVAQRPPPFARTAYPRIRTVRPRRFPARSRDGDGPQGERDANLSRTTGEAELEDEFMERLLHSDGGRTDAAYTSNRLGKLPSSSHFSSAAAVLVPPLPALPGEDVDMLREALPSYIDACGPLGNALLDYVPFAQYIVLQKPLPAASRGPTQSTSQGSVVTMTPSLSGSARSLPSPPTDVAVTQQPPHAAAPSSSSSGPRRTTFKFTAAAASASAAAPTATAQPAKRPCTELQVGLLRRGLPPTIGLRESEFRLVSSGVSLQIRGGGGGEGGAHGANMSPDGSREGARCWIPEGDTIEDFSD